MIHNYFLAAKRQFQRNRFHNIINIFGLAIGIAACLVIALTIYHEFSYDLHYSNTDRIYRITTRVDFGDEWVPIGGVPAPIPHVIREEVTGLEATAAFHTVRPTDVVIPEGKYMEAQEGLVFAEPDFFDVFSGYQWAIGSPKQSLNQPYQVVLTETKAKAYFGEKEAIGKTVTYFDTLDFVVSGILKDNRHKTDLLYTDYLSYPTLRVNQILTGNYGLESWGSVNGSSLSFLKLAEGTTSQNIKRQLSTLNKKYSQQQDKITPRELDLQPLSDVHFNASYPMNGQRVAHKPTLYGLFLIALFLLLTAAANFINLETARTILRSREVGIRKTLGSSQRELILQFLGETLMITILAGVLSLFVAGLGIRYFSDSLPPELSLLALWKDNGWIILLAIIIIVTLLAGLYPAWVLSKYSPAFALKNQASETSGVTRRAHSRRALILFQFIIAQAFILSTLIVSGQLRFLLSADLGFQSDAVIHFAAPNWWDIDVQGRINLAQELQQLSGVTAVSLSNSLPATSSSSFQTVTYITDTSEVKANLYTKKADTSFLNVYRIEILAGRKYRASDTLNELLINETAAKSLGIDPPLAAVGELIKIDDNQILPVVGVIRDFHDSPLREVIHPLMIGSESYSLIYFNILLSGQGKNAVEIQNLLSQINNVYKQFYPEEPFVYEFYDDTIANFYKTELRTARLINVATWLAVIISVLGLFGLVSFTTNRRTKEVSIRKVLGSTTVQIMALLSWGFIKLVLFSFAIAAPVAWYFSQEWLDNFAYQIDIGITLFLLTLTISVGIALATVLIQSWRVALTNPAQSLRSE
ncbi:MAG: ABC transporter permease [Bacteroidota bacterium]